ncbi:hypothetical protein [Conexibacter woesei]|uniref:hypothetical protein n=1 Tax=Conexibacter woesei TaxID=191495 RepID=UPI001916E12B|nr:hypothetical protein [Conexibacter woesei]
MCGSSQASVAIVTTIRPACRVPSPFASAASLPGQRLQRFNEQEEVQEVSGTIYRPGNTVQASGIYNVVNSYGTPQGRQVTCVEGEPFPPTQYAGEYGYVLAMATQHSRF